MRGDDRQQSDLFIYGSLEERVPKDHPLRPVRAMADIALEALSPSFAELYSKTGRPSIAPEKLLRALLVQLLYSIRSERLLMEQLEYNMLFRWFVGLSMNEAVWNHAVFSKNRERLLEGEVANEFFAVVVEQARAMRLLSDEHFTVDGTLIDAWASHKSFRPKDDRNDKDGGNFHGKQAPQRDARIEERSGGTAVSERAWQGSEAVLHGPCADGEPQRLGGGCRVDIGRRTSRTGSRAGDGVAPAGRSTTRYAGGRQGLRHKGFCSRVAGVERDAACGAEHVRTPQPDRRSGRPAIRVTRSARGNANAWKKSSVGLRRRRDSARHVIEAATEWVDVHLCRCCLQLGPHEKSVDGDCLEPPIEVPIGGSKPHENPESPACRPEHNSPTATSSRIPDSSLPSSTSS